MSTQNRFRKIQLKRWELARAVFEVIFLGLVAGGGTSLKPTLPLMVDAILNLLKEKKNIDAQEKKVKRILANLEKKDIIYIEKKNGNVIVHAVNNNHPKVLKYSIKSLIDFKKSQKKWSGKWFMVFFDVPEIQRNKRDYLRKFLKDLGFFPYQKSVYLFPYECEKEVGLIKKIVEGGKYMKYIIAEKIEDEEKAKIFFKLS